MNKTIKIKIYGRVQGVWFRESTKKKALELGISGWVRNEPDGSVYAEAQGEPGAVKKFIAWCRQGPELSKIDRVEVIEITDDKEYRRFEVKY